MRDQLPCKILFQKLAVRPHSPHDKRAEVIDMNDIWQALELG